MANDYHRKIAALYPGAICSRTERTRTYTVELPNGTRGSFDRVRDALEWTRTEAAKAAGTYQAPTPTLDPVYVQELIEYAKRTL